MIRWLAFLPLLLASCSRAPTPEECKALAEPKAWTDRCFGGEIGPSGKYIGDLKCWPFSKSQRLSGIWVIDLESSLFFPNASSIKETMAEPIWLETPLLYQRKFLDAQGGGRRIYAVEMEGRKSLCDGYFGHMGMAPKEVIADRFYSLRRLPTPKS